ncbi:uncharacterized protein LOC134533953 isoform X2 [Bacillus rossius redtenbacheri]|uniref:uncharacterized protein LOC134533953 isoform X2 n=1 Tax=Bacillus rossius redtenbacheri TaxID=93214 RepID=UPI002FDE4C6A
MSFTLAGINDHLSKFVDEQVEAILQQTLEYNQEVWKIKSQDITERVKESPEIKKLVQNIEKQLSRSIFSARNNRAHSPVDSGVAGAEFDAHDNRLRSKLERLPSISSFSVSQITAVCNFQPLDIVSSKSWSNRSVILRNSLFCNNCSIFKLGLQIHAKLTHSLTSAAIKEGFINLTRGLLLYYKKFYSDLTISLSSGIDLNNPVHFFMVKICHLILDTVKILPKNWVRYGKRSVECVCESFLNLLTFHVFTPHALTNGSNCDDCAYPLHIVSTLDPSAGWCVCWLHSTFGQSVLFNTSVSLAKTLVQTCVETLLILINEKPPTTSTIIFATMIHSANVLKTVLRCRDSLNLFPVITSRFGEHSACLSIYNFGVLLARYIFKCGNSNSENHLQQIIVKSILDLFVSLVENCPGKVVDEEIIRVIMEPMCSLHVENHSGTLLHTVSVLNAFLKSEACVKWLWGPWQKQSPPSKFQQYLTTSHSALGYRKNSISSLRSTDTRQQSTKSLRILTGEAINMCPAHLVFQLTTHTLRTNISHYALEPLLDLCGSLLELREGVLRASETEHALISAAAEVHRQLCESYLLSQQTASANPNSNPHLSRSLLLFFARVSSTLRGASLLSGERDIVLEAARVRLSDPRADWEEARFRLVTARLLVAHGGHEPLVAESTRALAHALHGLREACEDPEVLAGSERTFLAAVQSHINIVHTVASTLQGVASLLSEPDDDGSSLDTLVDIDGPTTFLELLTSDLLTEEWDYIALLTLRLLVVDLDVLLFLNHKINLQARLLQRQLGDSSGQQPPAVIVDRCSLLRHDLLVSGHAVGGPGELERGNPMFAALPPPHALYRRPKPRSRTLAHLHRFLRDTEPGLHDAGWVASARKAYVSSAHCDLKPNVVLSVVEQLARCCSDSAAREVSWLGVEPGELFPEDVHGIQLVVRYGLNCGLLQPVAQNADNLTLLVRMCHGHRGSPAAFTGFPWFVATAFNLCCGCLDRRAGCAGG